MVSQLVLLIMDLYILKNDFNSGKGGMDLITVDCSKSDLKVGDKVTLWGNSQIGVEILSAENNEIPRAFAHVFSTSKRKFINE